MNVFCSGSSWMFTCMLKPLSWHLKTKKKEYQLLTIPEFFDHTKFSFWGRMSFSFIWLKFHCTLDHEPPNENMRNSNTLKCNLWTLLHYSQHCFTSFVLLWDKVHTNNYLCLFGNKLKYKTQAWVVFFLYSSAFFYTKSLIKELQNNVNAQDITLSGAISKCNLVPTHSCPSSHICGDAFLPFNHQLSVCVTCMSVFIFPSWFGEHVIIPKATSSVVWVQCKHHTQ